MGAGGAEGAIDASNILKPALAAGKLRCIGSTTYQEYRGAIERDRALARRFQKIDINEPSLEDTIAILKGLKSRYEAHIKSPTRTARSKRRPSFRVCTSTSGCSPTKRST